MNADVWLMRSVLMTAWDLTAKDVQDLPLDDLVELYEETLRQPAAPRSEEPKLWGYDTETGEEEEP